MAPTILRPDNCRSCKFCQLIDARPGEPEGECHGGPPQVVATVVPDERGRPALNVQTLFPRVQLDWHCGVHRPRIELATH